MADPFITPDPSRSALLTIDVQNDFVLEGAPAQIAGTLDVLPAMKTALDAFRRAGRPIIHVVRLYRRDGANVDACRRALIAGGVSIVSPGSDGAELVAALMPSPSSRLDAEALLSGKFQKLGESEWAMYKPRWSAFHGTGLDDRLRGLGVSTVVVAGCNFPNCPRSTLYDASGRDYRIVLLTDALSGLYPKGLEELQGIGIVPMPATHLASWLEG